MIRYQMMFKLKRIFVSCETKHMRTQLYVAFTELAYVIW